MAISKKQSWILIGVVTTGMLSALLLMMVLTLINDVDKGLPNSSIINMTMDAVCTGVCIVIFDAAFLDHKIDMATVYYLAMLMLSVLLLLWDFEAWDIDNIPAKATYNKLVNYYVYGFLLFDIVAFWLYVRQLIERTDRRFFYFEMLFYALFVIGMLNILSNSIFGHLFTVDATTGSYRRGDLFISSTICPFAMLMVFTVAAWKYVDGFKKKLALYSFLFFPVLAFILQAFNFGSGVLYIAIIFANVLVYGNFYVEKGNEITRKEAELEEQKVAMLVSQINPGFLDKSLENIAKMDGNPPETQKAIREFAKYMRNNIKSFNVIESIPFEKEMDHVETYLDLEKLRFKEKLTINYDVRDTDFHIPALTLQMLVENAIKHGITVKEDGGTVTVKTEETDTAHIITVVDDGVGFDDTQPPKDESRSHIGLTNVKKRLKDMVNGELVIKSTIGVGTTAIVTIPKNTQ